MSPAPEQLRRRLVELRDSFDRSFAEPADRAVTEVDDLLAVRVGDEPYAIRLEAIAALATNRRITWLPGAPPTLLGVTTLRTAIIPVYDLAALLGHANTEPPRWLVLARGQPELALAFDRVEGHLRLPREAIAAATTTGAAAIEADGARPSDLVHTPSGARALIDLSAVRASIVAAIAPNDRDGGR